MRHTVALPQEPTPLAPPGWTDWQLGLQREILRLITQKNSSIREEISDRVDEVLLRTTLEATGGNISQASHRLGISRPTLRSRLRQLKIATPNSPT
ncbi:helix-turn-helix domain-containing protein [Stieleria maiorica]|uniref:helix-turn-helix domain-containing protein n=1 Tax=Stieleria maiorica TaxID=2795974 RepID=UPI00142F372E|nr:helix-turn-helix domain-containing protein [Stieleria maiorica]